MLLSNRLKLARVKYGDVTQEELAQKVGCSRQTINSIENSKFIPSVELALLIAKSLDAPFEDIFFLNDPKGGKK